jgi:diguanylate cyclase (GGDEF)-like protein
LQSDIRDARILADRVHRYFQQEIALTRSGNLSSAREKLAQGKVQFDRLRAAEAVTARRADRELEAQRSHTRFLARAGFVVGLIVCGALILSAIAFVVLVQRASRYRITSMRDSLTGATNRRGAMAAIDTLISASPAKPFGLVFIDLDGFKKVNDAYGHAAGDAILKEVASRLRLELRDTDEVCRLGGDEFVCVISPPTNMDQLLSIAGRLRKAVARPYSYDDDVYAVGCSVGVSMYPQHGSSIEALLQRADRAMYDAKAAGGGVRG